MGDWRDRPAAVRAGEELDGERLEAYLRERLPGVSGRLEVEQFPRGYSNLTYLLRLGERELVLRRPPFGANVKGGHDMNREYTILSHLAPVYPKAPRPLLYCDDEAVLGAPFYVMERLRGVILRPHLPAGMAPPPPLMARIATALVDNLAVLHAIDYQAAGLGELGRPEGYVERQIQGWAQRYAKARTDDVPEMERAAGWLAEHRPPESGAALIHNDYKYDNVVLDPADWSRIIGVLDWEMATVGDPLMDLGTALGYWVEPADPPEIQALQLSPTTLPGNPPRAEVVEQYARRSGRDVSNVRFYYVYGLFKVAVIVQQIYYRYKMGYTQDPRFADLILAVRAFGRTAGRAIEQGI
ncbi:MAG: phosphotransferase family protein [Chloroflexi bacterium]|nr:phosphotransferase family protein [Chloroflexota bacterium]MCI0576790.1 phosphotransferase family protein [Chloroflexota bacterium]MCI0650093.1 phosphotransferase family protein [Chloroflexota bacterium]MCI0731392.1 phosphotransferase family protein [Chloroflexota bacterium]